MGKAKPIRPAVPDPGTVDPVDDDQPGRAVSIGDRPDPFAAGLGDEPDEN